MKRRRICLIGVAVLACIYAAAPYVTVARLYLAMRNGDTETLARMIDWSSLRQGLKQDLADGIIGMTAPQLVASNGLPPFGAGFFTGIAAGFVDKEVTPDHLALAAREIDSALPADPTAPPVMTGMSCVHWAFFDSPTSFTLLMHAPGQSPDEMPMRVRLELEGMSWKVVRAWIPQDLVDRVHFRT